MNRAKKGEYRSRVYTDRPAYADYDSPQKFDAILGIIMFDAAGRTIFHSYSANIRTKEQLQKFVDDFPRFRREMGGGK